MFVGINLEITSGWFLLRKFVAMHGPYNVKFRDMLPVLHTDLEYCPLSHVSVFLVNW